jgi:hypothetical protein
MKKLLMVLLTVLMLTTLMGCKEEEKISDNWADMEFKLAGVKYTYPYFFEHFSKNGWKLDDEYDLPGGKYTDFNYQMYNEKFYDSQKQAYVVILVDFENYDAEAKSIKECHIWYLSFCRILDLGVDLDNVYEIELAKGIKWGSTEAEIVAAYGQVPADKRVVVAEDGYVALIYQKTTGDLFTQMVLYIYDDGGLFTVDFEVYRVHPAS